MTLEQRGLSNKRMLHDLLGDKIQRSPIRERLGFLPISIWRPDWNKVRRFRRLVGDEGQTREDLTQRYMIRLPVVALGHWWLLLWGMITMVLSYGRRKLTV